MMEISSSVERGGLFIMIISHTRRPRESWVKLDQSCQC